MQLFELPSKCYSDITDYLKLRAALLFDDDDTVFWVGDDEYSEYDVSLSCLRAFSSSFNTEDEDPAIAALFEITLLRRLFWVPVLPLLSLMDGVSARLGAGLPLFF